ncbi:IS1294 transposase [Shigella dysenteriae]|nr:IS1294 transposase [Shigella dysenteriae]
MLPHAPQNMYALRTCFIKDSSSYVDPQSIDTVLLSVGAEKLSQREWDWMKMLKPMDPPPAMVAASILERRGDTAALTRLQDTGG